MTGSQSAGLSTSASSLFAGTGTMAAQMRRHDWAASPPGRPESWPQSLKTAVGIMLSSRYAMWMAWGDDLTFFCNDAYFPTLGVKGDWALGARSDKVWAEIWKDIGPRIRQVLGSGIATWDEGLLLFLERSGYVEETYHTFSYSPLRNDSDVIAGMLCVVTEETERVIGERRLTTLRDLAAELSRAQTEEEVGSAIARSLATKRRDLPFALVYLFDDDAARLVCATGLPEGHRIAPPTIGGAASDAPWPAATLRRSGTALLLDDLARLSPLPSGDWERAPRQVRLQPIAGQSAGTPAGFLVVGLNPFRPLDPAYAGFLDLLAGQISASLANAHSYEQERRRAQALAKLDRAKTAFFSNVSHEFRTPLTLMLGPLEDLLSRAPGSLSQEDLSRVGMAHRNGARLLKLVNTLLDFSRIEAGRHQASYEATDLAKLTTELASSFRSAMDRAGLAYRVETQPLPGTAYVDRDMWEKIVLNLISNAFKFTFAGEVAVTLGPSGDGSAALLTVRDTGTGIPAGELPRLFERFHRVEGAKGRTFEGSGIGLALVQELVNFHGGTIGVESTPGQGSTFSVSIPLGAAHLPADRLRDRPGDEATSGQDAQAYVEEVLRWLPADGSQEDAEALAALMSDVPQAVAAGNGGGRVLLADDNADMRGYIRRLLVAQGYAVDAVDNGEAALEALRKAAPDLVLSDVMMPRLDGFELLKAIRAEEAWRGIPVILLSARAGEEARVEGVDAGADDYLTKPFSARELTARVGAALAMARMRQEAIEALRQVNETLETRIEERTRERDRIWRLSRELMMVTRTDSVALAVNPAWTDTLGWSERELTGRALIELVHPDDRAAADRARDDATAARPTLNLDLRLRHRDGSYRSIVWTSVPGDGVVYSVGRDVTEAKAADERLRQAQKMETIGQLTGGVAHDFNNLLTVIVGNLETIRRDLEAGDRGGHAHRVIRAADNAMRGAQRAAALTERLLAFARRQPLDPKAIDANKLIAAMSDLLASTLGEHIEIETVLAGGLWHAHADPNQIESALLNLAVNARDAMPDGGRLTIETANAYLDEAYAAASGEVIPGQYVVIAVSDTGTGMSKAVIERAFEPFFTTKDVGHGTGLGLSQVYGFVKQSGGHVKIYSEVGQGTTIKVYLPRLVTAAEQGKAGTVDFDAPRADGAEIVLVVEDDADVRAYSTDIMRELGYSVREAANGASALSILEREPGVRLLFTDVGLPGGMNGRQLADAARRLRPGLPVLFTTGYARNAIVHGGRLDPGVQLLPKPFTYGALAAKVRDVLDAAMGVPRILVVEDEVLVRMVAVDGLMDAGFRVEEAGNAAEALAKVRGSSGRFDAAILDMGLPDRPGDQLAAELRAIRRDLPLLIASGYDSRELQQRFAGDPRIAVMSKPYDSRMLRDALLALGVGRYR